MTNNIVPPSHQAESKQGLRVTGGANSPQNRLNLSVNTNQRSIKDMPDSAEIGGSENNPIVLDSAPESVAPSTSLPRHSRPRRNVGTPKFFGYRQFIDEVFEKDYQTTSTVQDVTSNQPTITFAIFSPSDLLTLLAEAPQIPTLVAETTLTWSSKKSCRSERTNYMPIMSILKNTPSGSYSPSQPLTDTFDEVEKSSDISSTIDSDVKAKRFRRKV